MELRQSLLDAAVADHQLPASDYTDLVTHLTNFAYDSRTNVYYLERPEE